MREQHNQSRIPSTLTSEYERIGVRVKDNFGLTEAVAVNALTGVMHAICTHGTKEGFVCDCPSNLQPPDCPSRFRNLVESERETRFGLFMAGRNHAIIKSISAISFRACRNCERILKANSPQSNTADAVAQ